MSSLLARSIADSESNSARGYEPFSLEPFCFDGDRQLKERCETQCQLELQSCIDGGCESKESCYKTNVDCVDCELFNLEMCFFISACPCHLRCPNGCFNCQHPVCSCRGDLNDNELYSKCLEAATSRLAQCYLNCSTDDCSRECPTKYEEEIANCPCAEKCPIGCPCPNKSDYCTDYEIDAKHHLLVLSTFDLANVPMLLDSNGNAQPGLEFEYENYASVYGSCSFTHNGKHYVVGGHSSDHRSYTQISTIQGCNLRRSEYQLPFYFSYGACLSIERQSDNYILLCFPSNDGGTSDDQTKCWRWNGDENDESFAKVTPSKYKHKYTALSNYKGVPLAVGGWHSNTNQVESLQATGWSKEAHYYFKSEIYRYATVSTADSVIIFGGCTRRGDIDDVAEFKDKEWKFLGVSGSTYFLCSLFS